MTKSPAIAAPPGRAAARPAGAQPHRRVITQETGARPRGRTGPGRRLWAFGFMAGVQAALLSFVCVVVPAVAAFTATSAASVNDGLSWLDAARRGTDLWLLGHWGTMTVGSGAGAATVTLAPLGVALVSLLASRFLGRVSQASGWWLAGFGTLGFAVVTALVGFVVATPDGRTTAPAALVGAVVVAFLGNAWAAWPSSGWHGAQDLAARARKASDAGRPAWAAASRAVRVA
ncbi:MAG: DUF6350 family protein, partial [Bifidobacteriaceae bacterium]|nr:DUF6350 family protein [Bifidobacteriaceae bacterium]